MPPVSLVIPAMDAIDRAFTTASMGGDRFSLPIKVALDLGKRIMNKYYNLTDESEIYRVSIGTSAVFFYFKWPLSDSHHSSAPKSKDTVFQGQQMAASLAGRCHCNHPEDLRQ
jgi:uncharacterized membrane protein